MKLLIALVMCFIPLSGYAAECNGHVFFYDMNESGGEARSDYAYYFHKVKNVLPTKGISISVHTELPIESKTCFNKHVEIAKNELKYSLGYILVKPNLEKKVLGGVYTGVDFIQEVDIFFNLKTHNKAH